MEFLLTCGVVRQILCRRQCYRPRRPGRLRNMTCRLTCRCLFARWCGALSWRSFWHGARPGSCICIGCFLTGGCPLRCLGFLLRRCLFLLFRLFLRCRNPVLLHDLRLFGRFFFCSLQRRSTCRRCAPRSVIKPLSLLGPHHFFFVCAMLLLLLWLLLAMRRDPGPGLDGGAFGAFSDQYRTGLQHRTV
jgi:hypothetical protein